MMQNSASNPVYHRLTRGSKGPSARAIMWIGIGVGLAGFIAAVLPPFVLNQRRYDMLPATLMFVLSLLAALICQLWGLVLASATVVRFMHGEEHALLRLTALKPSDILSGYVAGAAHEQRILRAIGLWVLPAGLPAGAYLVGTATVIIDCLSPTCGSLTPAYMMWGIVPALGALLIGMYLYWRLWRYTTDIGVWIGLRWPDRASTIAGGLAAVCIAADIAIVVGTIGGVYASGAGLLSLLLCPVSIIAAFGVPFALARHSRKDSIRVLEGIDR